MIQRAIRGACFFMSVLFVSDGAVPGILGFLREGCERGVVAGFLGAGGSEAASHTVLKCLLFELCLGAPALFGRVYLCIHPILPTRLSLHINPILLRHFSDI